MTTFEEAKAEGLRTYGRNAQAVAFALGALSAQDGEDRPTLDKSAEILAPLERPAFYIGAQWQALKQFAR